MVGDLIVKFLVGSGQKGVGIVVGEGNRIGWRQGLERPLPSHGPTERWTSRTSITILAKPVE